MPLSETHFTARLGQTLKDGRYTILRKLGQGVTSTIWLVRTPGSSGKFSAAKILSVEATKEIGPPHEVEFLQAITQRARESEEGFDYLPRLHDHFIVPSENDVQPPDEHLCIVQTLLSTSVSALCRSAPSQSLPVYMVRSIIYMTLHALQTLHSLRITHTDVNLDNILFTNARFSLVEDLEAYLAANPTEVDQEGKITTSQPLPHQWTYQTNAHEAERMTVVLIDYGQGKWTGQPSSAKTFRRPSLRPPEVLPFAGISTAVDIWAIGCLTFELMVGHRLFTPKDGEEQRSIKDDQFAMTPELTDQTSLPKSALDRTMLDGNLSLPELNTVKIEDAISVYKIPGLSEEDIKEGADFIRSCLHPAQAQRKTAGELLEHPFVLKAFSC